MGRKNRKEEYDYNETLDEEWLNDENNKEAATPSTEEVVITGKKKKSKDKKTEDTAEENANEEEIVFSGKKKKNTKAKATKADTETTEESAEPEKTEEEIVITGKKKKATKKKEEPKTEKTETTPAVVTKATDTTETAETPEAQETTSSKKKKKKEDEKAKKKPGIGKALAAQLTKMREEEERKQKELEEKRKREEEEERLRIEQEEKEEEERRIQREIKKKLEKERKLAQQKEQEAKKLEAIRQQLVSSYGTTAAADAPQEQKKRVVYGDKRKKKPNAKENTENTTPSTTTTTTTEEVQKTEEKTEAVVEVKPSDQKAEQAEETWESWEDKDIDSWESHLKEEEENPVVEEVKPAVPSPAPVAAPTTTTDSNNNNNNKTESAEDKSGELRSPICCILGHVDTGKTKLLDNIRRTNVQEGEAGGITQQIGATFFPMDAVKEKTKKLAEQFNSLSIKVPGLLIIDTPGHESFNNLRSRGSGLCDIAVLVVDIMHGLEPQTLESINLLKMRKTPFIVALNKVDRIYGWQAMKDEPIQSALLKQSKSVQMEFEERVKETIVAFAEQSLNAQLYYKNKSLKEFRTIVSLVPTSAIDGTGIPDLLMLLIQLTQKLMSDKLLQLSQLQCTVLEVKAIEGLGTTIDCILVNGVLREGDTIVVCGMNGPIVTTIRALLTPQPLKEMRVKGTYIHHKVIHASQGVKIAAQELDKAIAGSSLFVVGPNDDIEALKKEVMQDLENMRKRVDTTGRGVWVQASTLGSLEALLEFLKESKIPVSGVNIGPVNKKDVMKCSIMLEHAAEYAVILAFDVKVTKDAQDLADNMGVKIFTAEIIYHLFDQFTAYMKKLTEDKKTEAASEAVFPCRLRIYPEYIFNKRDPIVLGVEILEGSLRIGTPISVATKECIELGKVTSIELNHKAQEKAKKGLSVAIKIEVGIGEQKREFGRHFDEKDELVSKITRSSLDLLKANFKDELDKDDVHLLKKLKDLFIKYGKFGADF